MSQKVVICGAGFLGSYIARAIAQANATTRLPPRLIQLASRSPQRIYNNVKPHVSSKDLVAPLAVDITKPETLPPAFEGAGHVISLVGLLHGTPAEFDHIQWKGSENVAKAAHDAGAKLVQISAIGANASSTIPYYRTKGLAENVVLELCGKRATIIRPSIVFGPEDDFFNRFAKLSKLLPFLPVFGGGQSKFQPVYVGDVGQLVEIVTRDDKNVWQEVGGQILEAGGPEVFAYRDLMELVLKYSGRWRPIISLPYSVGMLQGFFLERLPTNLFTVTRDQVEQLKSDNVAHDKRFQELIEKYSNRRLASVHDILPTYLGA